MIDKRELVINKGEEFKLSVREKIEKTDIFYDQYIAAAKMLDDIVAGREDMEDGHEEKHDIWCKTEYENNVIAFCGERGEGKSSAMISFVKAAYHCSKKGQVSIFEHCENVKDTYFAEPIVIDPSMFDGIHNVLDIVLAALYERFKAQYEADNQSVYANRREKLLDQFQKVYKCISMINNQAKMLDDEYDYEGNISKLSKLGQSTGLKDELEKLVTMYLEVMMKVQKPQKEKKSKSLLIAIDDLDLCSNHAYKMAEQIRKYLILPNVAIVMAVKIEQLELCVWEQNFKNYENVVHMKSRESGIQEEMSNMSERYVAKLIPKARRNYLPNVRMMHHVKLVYRDKYDKIQNGEDQEGKTKNILGDYEESSVSEIILHLIYRKTGMKFLMDKSGKNYFLPDNLRDMVNLVVLLADMEDPQNDEGYYDNIQKFSDYFERQWLPSNLDLKECKEIQKLMHVQSMLHRTTSHSLLECYTLTKKKNATFPSQSLSEPNNSFYTVMNWMEIFRTDVFGEEERKYAYIFHILYTIRLNNLLRSGQYKEMIDFIGGYVWAWNFQNTLPLVQKTKVDRSRFELTTFCAFNIIAKELYPSRGILLPEPAKKQYYIKGISKTDEDRKYKVMAWLLLGMLSNTYVPSLTYQTIYTFESQSIVHTNYAIAEKLHISLENYIVGLCSLDSIYDKVNMGYLGVSTEDLKEIFDEIRESNKEVIEFFRKIVSNVDAAMQFKEYCSRQKGITESGSKNDVERTQEAVNKFFRSAEKFAKDYLAVEPVKLNILNLKYDSGKSKIDISNIYALLVRAGVEESGGYTENPESSENFDNKEIDEKELERLVREFAAKLRERTEEILPFEKVSSYLITKTAQNAKKQMDILASNIQQYYSIHTEEELTEAEISNLCSFYGEVIKVYLINPARTISEQLYNKYKNVLQNNQKVCP